MLRHHLRRTHSSLLCSPFLRFRCFSVPLYVFPRADVENQRVKAQSGVASGIGFYSIVPERSEVSLLIKACASTYAVSRASDSSFNGGTKLSNATFPSISRIL